MLGESLCIIDLVLQTKNPENYKMSQLSYEPEIVFGIFCK